MVEDGIQLSASNGPGECCCVIERGIDLLENDKGVRGGKPISGIRERQVRGSGDLKVALNVRLRGDSASESPNPSVVGIGSQIAPERLSAVGEFGRVKRRKPVLEVDERLVQFQRQSMSKRIAREPGLVCPLRRVRGVQRVDQA